MEGKLSDYLEVGKESEKIFGIRVGEEDVPNVFSAQKIKFCWQSVEVIFGIWVGQSWVAIYCRNVCN